MAKRLRTKSGAIVLDWYPETRLAVIWFEHPTDAKGDDAIALSKQLTEWIGTKREPFGLLGDGSGLKSVDADYRSIWGNFFRRHKNYSFIAFYNMGAFIRLAAEMFRIGTGIQLKAFSKEEDAREWLREQGIPA